MSHFGWLPIPTTLDSSSIRGSCRQVAGRGRSSREHPTATDPQAVSTGTEYRTDMLLVRTLTEC